MNGNMEGDIECSVGKGTYQGKITLKVDISNIYVR